MITDNTFKKNPYHLLVVMTMVCAGTSSKYMLAVLTECMGRGSF
jgi:hypothetical protein